MHFKLICVFADDSKTDKIMDIAREKGATGSTLISNARGEGLSRNKTFFGLTLDTQRDIIMLLVEEHMSREILESIADAGEFNDKPGSGIAFVLDIEDVVGVSAQIATLAPVVEEEI